MWTINFSGYVEKLQFVESWVHEAGTQESDSDRLEQNGSSEVNDQFRERASDGIHMARSKESEKRSAPRSKGRYWHYLKSRRSRSLYRLD